MVFQILEENVHDMAGFRGYGYFLVGFRWWHLFPGLFQIIPEWFQVVLDGFRSFHQVVPLFSKSIDFLGEKVQFSRDVSWKFCE